MTSLARGECSTARLQLLLTQIFKLDQTFFPEMDGSDTETVMELELHLNPDEILDLSSDDDQASEASESESSESETDQQSEPAPKRSSVKEVTLRSHLKV